DAARLADARRAVHEGDLAQPPSRFVGVDVRGDEVAIVVRVGLEPDEPTFRELAAQPVDQPPAERERERALERPARLARLRAREGLLRRHVRRERPAVEERLRAAEPARVLDEPDVELGAGTPQLEPGEAELRQPRRAAAEFAEMLEPAGRPFP